MAKIETGNRIHINLKLSRGVILTEYYNAHITLKLYTLLLQGIVSSFCLVSCSR